MDTKIIRNLEPESYFRVLRLDKIGNGLSTISKAK